MSDQAQRSQHGFTLIEIMITLALGLIISGAIVQVMVSNSITEKLNRSLASTQESGRFIINRLRNQVLMTGLYNPLSPNLDRSVDIVSEEVFVRNHAVVLPGDFATRAELGSKQGSSGSNDTLVVGMQGTHDCRGYSLGYAAEQEFYVVNEYFVDGDKLKCRGFDGRVLRGQKSAVGHNGHAAFTLLDDVAGFQVTFGVTDSSSNNNLANPYQFLRADQLSAAINAGDQVVAIRLAVLVKGDSDALIPQANPIKLLNEEAFTPNDKRIYQAFETTITLRNMKNFVRSNA